MILFCAERYSGKLKSGLKDIFSMSVVILEFYLKRIEGFSSKIMGDNLKRLSGICLKAFLNPCSGNGHIVEPIRTRFKGI
jgi:hypothetical protein